jgi:cytochrome c biogenesis protein CcmG/thiol:disulfide interchange protein DsbE
MATSTGRKKSGLQLPSPNVVFWFILAVAVGLVLGWNFYWRPELNNNRDEKDPAIGKKLPLVELQPLTGSTEGVSLEKLRDKVVLINYWGTWCPPCRQEFPHIVELWDRYRDKQGFELLSVSSSGGAPEDVEEVRGETQQFLKAKGVTMPTYIDANGASRKAIVELTGKDGFAYPTTVLLDRQGIVRSVWTGYAPGVERQMERMVSKVLAE